MNTTKKFMIVGHAGHGKDEACKIIQARYGLRWTSSSWFACESLIFPALAPIYNYKTPQECFDDRNAHRDFWYQKIWDYNRDDPTTLAREIFKSNDIYCGIRHSGEFEAIRQAGLVDLVIWIDASERLPLESESSNSMKLEMADIVIDNNQSLPAFEEKLHRLFDTFMEPVVR